MGSAAQIDIDRAQWNRIRDRREYDLFRSAMAKDVRYRFRLGGGRSIQLSYRGSDQA